MPFNPKRLAVLRCLSGGAGGETGGGGGNSSQILSLIDRSITEFSSEEVTTIGKSAFSECAALTTVNVPNVETVMDYGLSATAITSISLPNCKTLAQRAFSACYQLESVYLPKVTSIGQYCFGSTKKMTVYDLPALTSIGVAAFQYNDGVKSLILRNTETVCTLAGSLAYNNDMFAAGTAFIYVPAALLDTYTTATNWVRYATQFRALEDYTVDGTITGELDESKI